MASTIQNASMHQDQEISLSSDEFCNNIIFKGGLPKIIPDLILHLTKRNLHTGNQIWEEDEEQSPTIKEFNADAADFIFQDNEAQNFKNTLTNDEYNLFLNLFKKFLNVEQNNKKAML